MTKVRDIIEATKNCDEHCNACSHPNPCDVWSDAFDHRHVELMDIMLNAAVLVLDVDYGGDVHMIAHVSRHYAEARDALFAYRTKHGLV